MQPVSAYERSLIDKIAANNARLAALQSQQAALLTDNGNLRDTSAGHGSNKGKKRYHGQESNSQVLFCCCCDSTLVVHV